jgi:hypothetical protein
MDTSRLKRVLLSLADAALRVDWLESEFSTMDVAVAARLLNALAEESEASSPDAREIMLTVVLFVIRPERQREIDALREVALRERLFGLGRLLRRGPPPSVRVPPPEERPVPDYGGGRELSLGERKSLARRPDRRAFERLRLDPHPLVIRQLVNNPKMVEEDAIRIATLRPARSDALHELSRCHRWMSRTRVRMAIIQNPGTPPDLSIPLLSLCNREELIGILKGTDTSLVLRGTAQELLSLRPPVPHQGSEAIH